MIHCQSTGRRRKMNIGVGLKEDLSDPNDISPDLSMTTKMESNGSFDVIGMKTSQNNSPSFVTKTEEEEEQEEEEGEEKEEKFNPNVDPYPPITIVSVTTLNHVEEEQKEVPDTVHKFGAPSSSSSPLESKPQVPENQEVVRRVGRPPKLKCPQMECHVCGKVLADLKGHLKLVHKITMFFCPQCLIPIKTKTKLKEHLKNVHQIGLPNKCGHCERSFKLKSSLNNHIKLVHVERSQRPFYCHLCHRHFQKKGGLQRHWFGKKCSVCQQEIALSEKVAKILQYVLRPKINVCHICAYNKNFNETFFADHYDLALHLKNHVGSTAPFSCPIFDCDHSFRSFNLFQLHVNKHRLPYYSCTLCTAPPTAFNNYNIFQTFRCLSSHVQRCHPKIITNSSRAQQTDTKLCSKDSNCPLCRKCQKNVKKHGVQPSPVTVSSSVRGCQPSPVIANAVTISPPSPESILPDYSQESSEDEDGCVETDSIDSEIDIVEFKVKDELE